MIIDKITMKDGTYFRICVDHVCNEWWQQIANVGEFASKKEMFDSGYGGMLEIEGYFENNIVTEVNAVYFFDEYEDIPVELTDLELKIIQDFILQHWDTVPDNAELQLGDGDWNELAYSNMV